MAVTPPTADPTVAPTAALFPGQGSSLAGAAALVERELAQLHGLACELVGCDPLDHAHESTRWAQPAIFLASLAGWRAVSAAGLRPVALAGHSLGELTALTAARAWSEEDGLRLVVARAALMADAADAADADGAGAADTAGGADSTDAAGGGGGMLALLGAETGRAHALAERFGAAVANDNAPGQAVLSGRRTALRAVARAARVEGLRAIALDVKGAFHSPAMRPAIEPFTEAVRAVAPAPPTLPVISCATARPFVDIPAELGAAIGAPVRWREVMLTLSGMGARRYCDVGPDAILARLARRNLPDCTVLTPRLLDEAA